MFEIISRLFGKRPKTSAQQDKTVGAAPDDQASQALFAKGQGFITQRQFPEAQKIGHELRQMLESDYGAGHPNTAYGYDLLGQAHFGQGQFQEALENYQTALDLSIGYFGQAHEQTQNRARMVAITQCELGQLEEAKAVLSDFMPNVSENPPLHVDFKDSLAFVTAMADGPEAACPIQEENVQIYRDHQQTETTRFASLLFNLAQTYDLMGNKLEALNASSEAGLIALSTYGPDHPNAQDIFRFQTALREAKERGEF